MWSCSKHVSTRFSTIRAQSIDVGELSRICGYTTSPYTTNPVASMRRLCRQYHWHFSALSHQNPRTDISATVYASVTRSRLPSLLLLHCMRQTHSKLLCPRDFSAIERVPQPIICREYRLDCVNGSLANLGIVSARHVTCDLDATLSVQDKSC